jgi:YVTN family beta-propeller protein
MHRKWRPVTVFLFFLFIFLVSALRADEGTEKASSTSAVYVSKILEGMVAVIDVNSDQLITFLRTGTNPAEIAVIEALDRAFVADLTDGTVTVIDTTDHSVVTTIDTGHPVAATQTDEALQRVYALDFSNGTPGTNLHEIDGATNTETADVAIGSRLQNIALDPDENRGYASDFEDGVIVFNISTLGVVTTLALSDLPHGVAVHPVQNHLYVTQIDGDTVTVFDTTTHGVVDTLTVGDAPQWIGLDLIRNKGFVTNEGDDTVSVIDLSTNTVKAGTIGVGDEPLTITIHEPAARAYVYNAGDGTIAIIDTINENVIATIEVLFADGFELGDTAAWSSAIP